MESSATNKVRPRRLTYTSANGICYIFPSTLGILAGISDGDGFGALIQPLFDPAIITALFRFHARDTCGFLIVIHIAHVPVRHVCGGASG